MVDKQTYKKTGIFNFHFFLLFFINLAHSMQKLKNRKQKTEESFLSNAKRQKKLKTKNYYTYTQ